ncbi:DUF7674 family protein [Kaistella jeonii]|uniref:DUF7674 domain-containing protein n=1 Tax=Kaistella jeonii TaxID=266749 RepID=A0A0C1FFR7_9FLAO|nr:hypothetical protein [Kaistella jeonii]KIA90638.1 hypothetical protein OA86_01790 [Kaistella jeonii]SFB69720.1 hypothetical protein SAMN05421876_101164 [Kaistella jeonii]VEI94763.1 Uncharacterised protein [Kaistella jeonii]
MTIKEKTELLKIKDLEIKTIKKIYKEQKDSVIRLYGKVEQMFSKGNYFTRSIIGNNYITPLSQRLEMNYSWGKQYLDLFPQNLKVEYSRQIYSSGI